MNRSAILLVACALVPAAASPEPLSRAEAVARALAVNPEVRRSLEDVAALEGQVDEAKADALPELTLIGAGTRYRDPSLLNSSSFDAFPPELRESLTPIPANVFDGYAQMKQTVFSFKLQKAIRAARLARGVGEEEVDRTRQAVALLAVRAYNEYLLSIEKVAVGEKAVRQKEKHLEMAQNRRTAGVATELDVLRSAVDLENTRAILIRLKGEADQARGRLNAAMVRPIGTPIEPTDSLTYAAVEITPEEAERRAWNERPEAKAIALNERIYSELIGIAQADARPRLDFYGVYGWSVREPANFFDSNFARWTAGVTLTVPVFDGFRTRGRVAQARAQRNKISQDRVTLENRIRLEAKEGVDRLNVARSVLEAADLNVSQAQRALTMTQANYQHGAATTLDVIDAQAALTLAESNRIQALFDHAMARALMRYVMAQDPLEPSATPSGEQR
ncbi:MAG TPA: TolC family protein [Vicinamibacteria bacterium]|nr:TolC family protein [Vicinamibacteria bacterium]